MVRMQRPRRRWSLRTLVMSATLGLVMGVACYLLLGPLSLAIYTSASTTSFSQSSGWQGNAESSLSSLQEELRNMGAENDALQKKLAAATAGRTCSDRHAVVLPTEERDTATPELAAFLRRVAVNNEVVLAVSNKNLAWPGGMLESWVANVRRAGIRNALVLALDDETKAAMDKQAFPAFRMDVPIPETQKDAGSNHAVSALKFRILTHFVDLGYSVFLSDVDVIFLQNPFNFLKRDSDIEGMSDGWDNGTAYGYNDVADDPAMGWGRYAHSMRVFVINSGTFYIRSTKAARDLLDLVIYRLETEGGWDQAVFNECIFFPNRPGYKDPGVTRRVLDYLLFMNSKTLFKRVRHDPELASLRPVLIHVNSHPEKFERMKAVEKRYVEGDVGALDPWPDGSGMPAT